MSAVPTKDCEGYFPSMLPSNIDEISFYIPVENNNSVEIAAKDNNGATRLACSMILAPGSRSKSQHGLASFPENVINDVDSSKDVVIVCHGFLAWRNQMLISHTAAAISKAMNCHTLRFDFSGNGHSDGLWRYSNYDGELNDLKQVVRYVRDTLKCRVSCVLGHSQGAAVVLNYAAWEQDEKKKNPSAVGETVPCFVNMAGRFFGPGATIESVLNVSMKSLYSEYTVDQQNELSETGKIKFMKRGETQLEIALDDVVNATKQDSKSVISSIMDTPVAILTLHGDADICNPVDGARKYDAAGLPNHELLIFEDGDHSFNGLKHMETIASAVRDFVQKHGGE
eukprot:CAMPEP_0195517644 /NCGR_PEP_ID=MMETSP0794_2-20130614/11166_1 /TAXON_ID=515487 /ORGANISM="Stephanopyxis turris, Strain CCMP 815" /LENGTH=339 /DNA_ID=CAMNT_0040646479 /DNA_START=36 /DNA_END=1055 /DNA_ORIENTATION=+